MFISPPLVFFQHIQNSPYKPFLLVLYTWLVMNVAYWGLALPYTLFLYVKFPAIEKYKIQQKVPWDGKMRAKALKTVAINVALITIPLNVPIALIAPKLLLPIPSWYTIAWQVLFCQFMEDITFYFVHRTLHAVPYLYKNFHKTHHEFISPFAWTAAYAHPIDFIFGNILQVAAGPLILNCHPLVLWLWVILRVWYTLDVHCGYSFPWGLERWIGFVYAGPAHHDNHHKSFNGNYSSTLRYLDQIFGTEIKEQPPKKD